MPIADNASELPDGLLGGVGPIPFYVPRDEAFGLLKQLDFGNALNASTIEVATALKENLKSTYGETNTFDSLDEIFKLYSEHDLASFPKPGVVQGITICILIYDLIDPFSFLETLRS